MSYTYNALMEAKFREELKKNKDNQNEKRKL